MAHISTYKDAQGACITTPALAVAIMWRRLHYGGIRFICRRTHLLHLGRERPSIVDKMPCLRAHAPSGIRTHGPSDLQVQEHEPLHHSDKEYWYTEVDLGAS